MGAVSPTHREDGIDANCSNARSRGDSADHVPVQQQRHGAGQFTCGDVLWALLHIAVAECAQRVWKLLGVLRSHYAYDCCTTMSLMILSAGCNMLLGSCDNGCIGLLGSMLGYKNRLQSHHCQMVQCPLWPRCEPSTTFWWRCRAAEHTHLELQCLLVHISAAGRKHHKRIQAAGILANGNSLARVVAIAGNKDAAHSRLACQLLHILAVFAHDCDACCLVLRPEQPMYKI